MDSQPRRILSIKTIMGRAPLSRTTIWRKSRDPEDPFPSTVEIGPNRTGIYEDEFEAWLAGLARRGASPAVPEDGAPTDEAEAKRVEAASQPSPLVHSTAELAQQKPAGAVGSGKDPGPKAATA